MSMPNENNAAGSTRSENFYMDTVVFKVENTLFKVPKAYFVENSSIFRDMFTLPQSDQANHEGSSDDHPVVLEHVSAEAFTALLEYMYPKQVHPLVLGTSPPPPLKYKSYKLLEALIELARRWMLRGLHAKLVNEYDGPRPPVQRSSKCEDDDVRFAIIGKKLGIPHWLRNGYISLATQPNPPSLSNAKALGLEDAVRIFHLREKFATIRPGLADQEKQRQVLEAFAEELQAVEREYKEFYSSQD